MAIFGCFGDFTCEILPRDLDVLSSDLVSMALSHEALKVTKTVSLWACLGGVCRAESLTSTSLTSHYEVTKIRTGW